MLSCFTFGVCFTEVVKQVSSQMSTRTVTVCHGFLVFCVLVIDDTTFLLSFGFLVECLICHTYISFYMMFLIRCS